MLSTVLGTAGSEPEGISAEPMHTVQLVVVDVLLLPASWTPDLALLPQAIS